MNLKAQINGSGWGIVAYDWHEDAATGSIWDLLDFDFIPARTAAFNADAHGINLADQLKQLSPNLREVQFIAHSAGSWAARAAAQRLLELNPYVVVQITLLDPFVPDPYSQLFNGKFSDSAMDMMQSFSGNERIQRLENYYANDAPDDGWNTAPWGTVAFPTYNTQERFYWRSGIDINQEIDWGNFILAAPLSYRPHYDWHAGPIQFYSDCLSASLFPDSIPSGLREAGCPFDYQQIAWKRSLYAWEAFLPRITAQPANQSGETGGSATFNVTANQTTFYEWYKVDGGFVGSGPSLTLDNLSSGNAGSYVVRVSNGNGQLYSQPATLIIRAGVPATLSAVTVSASQINLNWGNVANETGYKLERRLGSSGSWSQIATLSANLTSYSDTGLAAGTAYSYQVRAYSSVGDSAYSTIASAMTQSPVGTSFILTIASSNPSSGVAVNSFVGNGSFASGTTPTSRSFPSGTAVGVTCPPTLTGGLIFQKWQLDEIEYASSIEPTFTTVTMNGAHTLTAVYGATPPSAKVLASLSIEGPATVDERTSATYKSRATYTDGSSAYVNAHWADDSSYASISSAGLLDTSAVTRDQTIQVQATFINSAGDAVKTVTKDVTIRNIDTISTYALTLSANHGYISVQPQMSSYPAGTEVRLVASADDDYVFDHWGGDADGTDRTIYVTMNGNKSVTASFAADTSYGRLRVTLLPPEAIGEGAQWKAFPFTSWYDSGHQIDGVTPKRYYITLKDIPGWSVPQNIPVDVVGGATAQVAGTYLEIPGTVQVTIDPAAASAAGARWRLDGGAWQPSETTINGVPSGAHQIDFQSVAGWSTPALQQITVARAGVVIRTGQYAPPPGFPLITAISPKTGPIGGGTLLTIEGANFLTSSTVSVGGRAASTVTFLSATRLSAVTPASPIFGSAEIVVTSGTSGATNANAFAYGTPRGINMTLISSSSGNFQAVACNNQYLFIGQGTTFSIYNIANPANPIFVSSVTVPGFIQDIALNGNYAILAANDAGVQIVDISNSAAPRLRGFFDTSGKAYGVKVLAGRAYVADKTAGLLILDVTNPDALTLLSSLDLGTSAFDLALKNSVAGLFAIVAAQNKMFVADVSDPQSPSKISEVTVAGNNWSVALAGNLAFLSFGTGANTVDISNLGSPLNRGSIPTGWVATTAATGNTVVFAGFQGFQIFDVSGASTTARGHIDSPGFSMETPGLDPYRTAIQNGVVWVAGGTAVFGVNIANPDVPQRIFRKDDQGGRFEKIASSGSAIVAGTVDRLFGYNYSGNTITPVAALAHEGQSQGMVIAQDVLLDFRGVYYGDVNGERVRRASMKSGTLFQSLPPAVLPQMYAEDAYPIGDHVLNLSRAHSDEHPIISELDPTRTDAGWIVRQQQLAATVPLTFAEQIVGSQDFFIVAISAGDGITSLQRYNWGLTATNWQVSGLDFVHSMQLSHGNRYLHVGTQQDYRIYDLINPANPLCLSTNATAISEILIDRDDAYLAAYNKGVLVYDISDKSQPRLIRSYHTPRDAQSLAKIGDRLIVADYQAGIQVLGLPDIVLPQVFIAAPVALPQFRTTNSTIILGGGAEDNSGQISRVTWSNDRGGGGVAEGTIDWLVSAVSLQRGTNVLTVTAFDAEGNPGTDQITIISTPPDTIPPVISITGPKPDAEFLIGTNVITLSGSAADNQAVTNVTWRNDRGGSGGANFTGQNWSVASLSLALGPNVIQVTATDSSGNVTSNSVVIFFAPPDTNAPSVSIEFPTLNPVYETAFSTISISGTATDDSSVAKVEWSNARGGQGVANGLSPWSVNELSLQPGLNVIDVTAIDDAGNSSSDTLSVIFTPRIPELSVAWTNGNLVLLWPTNAVDFRLESITTFPAGNWTLESLDLAIVDEQYVATKAMTNEMKFYRLKK